MWVENTTQGFLLVIVIDINGAEFRITIVLYLSFSFRYISGRVKVAAEPQEWRNVGLDMGNFITEQNF